MPPNTNPTQTNPTQINPETPETYQDVENKQAFYDSLNNNTTDDTAKAKAKKRKIIIGSVIGILIVVIIVSIVVPLSMKHKKEAAAPPKKEQKNAVNPSKKMSSSSGPLGDKVLAKQMDGDRPVVMQNILITPSNRQGPFTKPPYAHEVSPFSNVTRLKEFTPAGSVKRVFVMGDIHGCLKEMNRLLELVQFQPGSDILVLAGDLIFKGADSLGVIKRARELGALCVRGNHDDKIIRLKSYIDKYGVPSILERNKILPEGNVGDPLRLGNKHLSLAKEINPDDLNYLLECPLILEIPSLKARVVHGGLDPAIPDVVNNDPWSVMNMRDMDENNFPTSLKISKNKKSLANPNYKHWTAVYNNKPLPDDMTVYYGHDASRGINFGNKTIGLDSGCIYGRKLSTIDIKSGKLFQVDCTGLYYSEHDD